MEFTIKSHLQTFRTLWHDYTILILTCNERVGIETQSLSPPIAYTFIEVINLSHGELQVTDDESELETAFKVVAIMQTITEDLDEESRKMWRKMLGLSDKPKKSVKDNRSTTTSPE